MKQQKHGGWYYYRRVPKNVTHLDRRRHVERSLKTKDRDTARRKAILVNQATEEYWSALLAADDASDARARHEAAVKLAKQFGLTYRPVAELANGDLQTLVDHLNAVAKAGTENPTVVKALTGTAETAPGTLTSLLEDFLGV